MDSRNFVQYSQSATAIILFHTLLLTCMASGAVEIHNLGNILPPFHLQLFPYFPTQPNIPDITCALLASDVWLAISLWCPGSLRGEVLMGEGLVACCCWHTVTPRLQRILVFLERPIHIVSPNTTLPRSTFECCKTPLTISFPSFPFKLSYGLPLSLLPSTQGTKLSEH